MDLRAFAKPLLQLPVHTFRPQSLPRRSALRLLALLLLILWLPSCSIRKIAVQRLGDAIASSGTTVASDDDPELIRTAIPFTLKLMESLLAEMPKHQQLLLATASGFTQYSYVFVQQDAEEMESRDLTAARALQIRARKLFMRARGYGLRGLEVRHPNFTQRLQKKPAEAVRVADKADVGLLYWTAAAWASAISLSKDHPDLVADLPYVSALIDRAMELDESFDSGTLHGFMVTYVLSRSDVTGDPYQQARRHFERALELSHRQLAAPLVSYAEAVSVQKQDRKEFQDLLERALAIDVDARPEWRLANLIMQHRARWLLSRSDELFAE
jgi:predicted anti-sigma-YlaC factor YlaD